VNPRPDQVPTPNSEPPGDPLGVPADDATPQPPGSFLTEAAIAVPESTPAAQAGSFLTAGMSVSTSPNGWMQAGWIEGSHCNATTPTVFVEFSTDGSWTDNCWTDSFPLTPGDTYYFALTSATGPVASQTMWLYWNDSWYSLATIPAMSISSTTCPGGFCVDPFGAAEGATTIGLAICGIAFEACGPAAAVGGTILGINKVIHSIYDGPSNCGGGAVIPNASGSTVQFSGYENCTTNVTTMISALDGIRNGSSYSSTGSSCNYCSSRSLSFSASASYYANYQSEMQTTTYDSSGQASETDQYYSQPVCECS
jgi:hypothetical protein